MSASTQQESIKATGTARALAAVVSVVVLSLLMSLGMLSAPAGSRLGPQAAGAATVAENYAERVRILTNQERTRRGLAPLAKSGCATTSAVRHSQNQARANRMYHQDIGAVMRSCGARGAAENVGYGNVTPEQLVAMWMKSSGHRANILNPSMKVIGVGAARTSSGRWYGTQVFLK